MIQNSNHLRQRETLERLNNPDYYESINKDKEVANPEQRLLRMVEALNAIRITTIDRDIRRRCENALRADGQLIEGDNDGTEQRRVNG